MRSRRRCRLVLGLKSCGGWEEGCSCDIMPTEATNTSTYRTGEDRDHRVVERLFTA